MSAENFKIQIRKGLLEFCILQIISRDEVYTSDIIDELKNSKIIVFDRNGYKKKSLNSKTYKSSNERQVTFVEFNKVNISSSKLRKI